MLKHRAEVWLEEKGIIADRGVQVIFPPQSEAAILTSRDKNTLSWIGTDFSWTIVETELTVD